MEVVPKPTNRRDSKCETRYDVEEIRNKIIAHITNLSAGKKANLINIGSESYDEAIHQIQKNERLAIIRALRDTCSDQPTEASSILSSIIPDMDIKIEDLPANKREELSSSLKIYSDEMFGDYETTVDPDLMFQQAQEMLSVLPDDIESEFGDVDVPNDHLCNMNLSPLSTNIPEKNAIENNFDPPVQDPAAETIKIRELLNEPVISSDMHFRKKPIKGELHRSDIITSEDFHRQKALEESYKQFEAEIFSSAITNIEVTGTSPAESERYLNESGRFKTSSSNESSFTTAIPSTEDVLLPLDFNFSSSYLNFKNSPPNIDKSGCTVEEKISENSLKKERVKRQLKDDSEDRKLSSYHHRNKNEELKVRSESIERRVFESSEDKHRMSLDERIAKELKKSDSCDEKRKESCNKVPDTSSSLKKFKSIVSEDVVASRSNKPHDFLQPKASQKILETSESNRKKVWRSPGEKKFMSEQKYKTSLYEHSDTELDFSGTDTEDENKNPVRDFVDEKVNSVINQDTGNCTPSTDKEVGVSNQITKKNSQESKSVTNSIQTDSDIPHLESERNVTDNAGSSKIPEANRIKKIEKKKRNLSPQININSPVANSKVFLQNELNADLSSVRLKTGVVTSNNNTVDSRPHDEREDDASIKQDNTAKDLIQKSEETKIKKTEKCEKIKRRKVSTTDKSLSEVDSGFKIETKRQISNEATSENNLTTENIVKPKQNEETKETKTTDLKSGEESECVDTNFIISSKKRRSSRKSSSSPKHITENTNDESDEATLKSPVNVTQTPKIAEMRRKERGRPRKSRSDSKTDLKTTSDNLQINVDGTPLKHDKDVCIKPESENTPKSSEDLSVNCDTTETVAKTRKSDTKKAKSKEYNTQKLNVNDPAEDLNTKCEKGKPSRKTRSKKDVSTVQLDSKSIEKMVDEKLDETVVEDDSINNSQSEKIVDVKGNQQTVIAGTNCELSGVTENAKPVDSTVKCKEISVRLDNAEKTRSECKTESSKLENVTLEPPQKNEYSKRGRPKQRRSKKEKVSNNTDEKLQKSNEIDTEKLVGVEETTSLNSNALITEYETEIVKESKNINESDSNKAPGLVSPKKQRPKKENVLSQEAPAVDSEIKSCEPPVTSSSVVEDGSKRRSTRFRKSSKSDVETNINKSVEETSESQTITPESSSKRKRVAAVRKSAELTPNLVVPEQNLNSNIVNSIQNPPEIEKNNQALPIRSKRNSRQEDINESVFPNENVETVPDSVLLETAKQNLTKPKKEKRKSKSKKSPRRELRETNVTPLVKSEETDITIEDTKTDVKLDYVVSNNSEESTRCDPSPQGLLRVKSLSQLMQISISEDSVGTVTLKSPTRLVAKEKDLEPVVVPHSISSNNHSAIEQTPLQEVISENQNLRKRKASDTEKSSSTKKRKIATKDAFSQTESEAVNTSDFGSQANIACTSCESYRNDLKRKRKLISEMRQFDETIQNLLLAKAEIYDKLLSIEKPVRSVARKRIVPTLQRHLTTQFKDPSEIVSNRAVKTKKHPTPKPKSLVKSVEKCTVKLDQSCYVHLYRYTEEHFEKMKQDKQYLLYEESRRYQRTRLNVVLNETEPDGISNLKIVSVTSLATNPEGNNGLDDHHTNTTPKTLNVERLTSLLSKSLKDVVLVLKVSL